MTSDASFGTYVWPEAVGGQSVSQLCENIITEGSMVIRTCLGFEQGWNLIDFSNCRNSMTINLSYMYVTWILNTVYFSC